MEETKKNTEEEKKSNPDPSNPFAGFDFSKLMQNETVMELLKHLLSGGGALAANYFLWIKPLQDKAEAMNLKIMSQGNRIKELEEEQDKLIDQLNDEKRENIGNLTGKNEFFTTTRTKARPDSQRKYRNARI